MKILYHVGGDTCWVLGVLFDFLFEPLECRFTIKVVIEVDLNVLEGRDHETIRQAHCKEEINQDLVL